MVEIRGRKKFDDVGVTSCTLTTLASDLINAFFFLKRKTIPSDMSNEHINT